MMNLPRLVIILFLGSLLNLSAEERDAKELFFEGNVRVAGEDYAEAIPLYEAALAKRPSANLHYNLGNAYYHLGDFGRARIHWERTLVLEPRHAFAGRHLQGLLREFDLEEATPGFWTRAVGHFSYNQWVWIGALSFWLIPFSVLARQWKKSTWLGLPAGIGIAGILLAGVSLVLLNPARHQAVILEDQAPLRVAPAPASPVAASLRPGQRVRVAERYGDFTQVLLDDGREGYLRTGQFEKIR